MTATIARARQLAVELLQVLDKLAEQPELPIGGPKAKAPRVTAKKTDRPALLLAAYERIMAQHGTAIGVPITPTNLRFVACLDPYPMEEAVSLLEEYRTLEDAFVSVEGYPLRLLAEKLPKVLAGRSEIDRRRKQKVEAQAELARHESRAEQKRGEAAAVQAAFIAPPPEFRKLTAALGAGMSLPEGEPTKGR